MLLLGRILYNFGDEDYEELEEIGVIIMSEEDTPKFLLSEYFIEELPWDEDEQPKYADLKTLKESLDYISIAYGAHVLAIKITHLSIETMFTYKALDILKG